jgi:hypothetical protein
MAILPKGKSVEVFNLPIDGSFGRFKTRDSYEVNYLLSSLPIADAARTLKTAAEAFPFEAISFEEMIQRDIDHRRVQEEIVEGYLESARDKVVFFPPLIVAVVSKENDRPIAVYDTVTAGFEGDPAGEGIYTLTYGRDKFQIQLNTVANDAGHSVCVIAAASGHAPDGLTIGQQLPYLPYAATLKANPRHVQLVVIDGQHRFEAMRILSTRRGDLIEAMDVPVCIVFTPGAVANGKPENIVKNLREMFVTINSTAKSVSGHFIDLLKDKSLASMAVRALAARWKGENTIGCRSRLQMLEWNERSDSRANQLNRAYTVTTVSILAEALRKHLFEDARRGVPQSLLDLRSVRAELEADPKWTKYSSVSDEDFDVMQEPVLKRQIEALVAPALDHLFTEPRPYKEKWKIFLAAVDELDRQASARPAVEAYRDHVLGEFRACSKRDEAPVRLVEEEFEGKFEELPQIDEPYFQNVFQQALIRVWILCSQVLWDKAEIQPEASAKMLVSALEKFCFKGERKLFDATNPYATRVLYQGGTKPNLLQWGKTAWFNTVAATLLQKNAWKELSSCIAEAMGADRSEESESVTSNLKELLEKSVKDLADEIKDRVRKDIENNWKTKEYEKATKDDLERLAASSDDGDQQKFRGEIDRLVENAYGEANTKFESMFGFGLEP